VNHCDTTCRPHRLQHRLASGLGALLLAVLGAGAPAAAATLPELSRSQLQAKITTLLRDMGDLKEYLGDANNGDKVVVKTFDGHPGCATLPKPTLRGAPLDDAKLGGLLAALEALDKALARNAQPVIEKQQAACLGPLAAGTRLPVKSPEEITASLSDMLRRVGDLAPYLVSAERAGPVVVKTFTHRHLCRTLPAPTPANTSITKPQLALVEDTLTAVNRRRTAHVRNTLVGRPAPCVAAR
jgi:hypothetical protein